jgi:hypothetical protein
MESVYLKHYYDTTEQRVVYYPTCNDLILNHNFIDEAENKMIFRPYTAGRRGLRFVRSNEIGG